MNIPLEARVKQDLSPQDCSPEAPAEVQRVRQALPTPGHAMETETPINTGEQRFRKHSPGQRVGGPDIWGHRVRAGFQIPNIYTHIWFRKENGQSNICSLAWSSRSSEHHAPTTRSPVHTQVSEWWPGDGDLRAGCCEGGDTPADQRWTSCLHPQHPALGVDSPTEQLDQTQPSHTFHSF